MNYTDLSLVKLNLGAGETADDNLLQTIIGEASRKIDHHCANERATDYFKLESVSEETTRGQVDVRGRLIVWPHKPVVNEVVALAYRFSPLETWRTVDPGYIEIEGNEVIAWINMERRQTLVKISYRGGYGESYDQLPQDLVRAATILTIRYYREAKSGLTDSIGVAELGTLIYTKALPLAVVDLLKRFVRVVPW